MGLRVGESERFFHALAPLRVNHLPTTKPARKQSGLVLKRSALAHMGSKCTAHLRHTFRAHSSRSGQLIDWVHQLSPNDSSNSHLADDLGYSLGRHPAYLPYRPSPACQGGMSHEKLCQSVAVCRSFSDAIQTGKRVNCRLRVVRQFNSCLVGCVFKMT